MISRLQQMLFALLLLACVVMAAFLIRLRERAQDRLQAPVANAAPLSEAPGTPEESVTLMMPDDMSGSLAPVQRTLTLPHDQTSRARILIQQLIASWSAPGSTHPVYAPAGVDSVFLMPAPTQNGSQAPDQPPSPAGDMDKGQLAVVNFDVSFPAAQPSGIEPETLTLLSIIQTLHANIPSITEVRFLVDGQQRETLAGHADLTRTYLADTTTSPSHE